MVFGKEAQSHTDRVVASTQEEIRRLARDGNGSQPEAAAITYVGGFANTRRPI